LDEDNDGKLQLKEIEKGLRNILGDVKANLRVYEELLIALDKNCNGTIDYTEFLTAASDKQRLLSESNLKLAFKLID
jgi:calcium-dependent protein kinase